MVGRSGRCCGAHPIWNLAVANPTALEHLGLDRTDRPARRLGPLLCDLGSPPRICCGTGPFFISTNYLYVGAGMVGLWQCAGLGSCLGGCCGGGEWVVFVVAGLRFRGLTQTIPGPPLCNPPHSLITGSFQSKNSQVFYVASNFLYNCNVCSHIRVDENSVSTCARPRRPICLRSAGS